MDSASTILVNTFTNAFALYPLRSFILAKDWIGTGLAACSFVASCLMHLSETKHNLVPFFTHFQTNSNEYLNLDRACALLLALYACYLFHKASDKQRFTPIIAKFFVGVLSLYFGERFQDWTLYTIFHTIWHFCSFTALGDFAIEYYSS